MKRRPSVQRPLFAEYEQPHVHSQACTVSALQRVHRQTCQAGHAQSTRCRGCTARRAQPTHRRGCTAKRAMPDVHSQHVAKDAQSDVHSQHVVEYAQPDVHSLARKAWRAQPTRCRVCALGQSRGQACLGASHTHYCMPTPPPEYAARCQTRTACTWADHHTTWAVQAQNRSLHTCLLQ